MLDKISLRKALIELLDAGLTQADVLDVLHDKCAGASEIEIEAAIELYRAGDEIEFDSNALASRADDGVWVQGWLWLPTPEDDE